MTTEMLTPQERRILDLFRRGFRTKGVASTLGVSVNTVRAHLRAVSMKLGTSTVVEAVLLTHEVEK